MTTETLTATMQAFAVDDFGAQGSLRPVPVPPVGEGEILVHVHAA
jgi:NADPH:quinone reductase-like Zn-dependent oxidoreductase